MVGGIDIAGPDRKLNFELQTCNSISCRQASESRVACSLQLRCKSLTLYIEHKQQVLQEIEILQNFVAELFSVRIQAV